MAQAETIYSVLLADDHPIFLEGLVTIIERDPQFNIICICNDGIQAQTDLSSFKPDLAVLDMSMPGNNGLELLDYIREQSLATKTIILTMHDDLIYFNAALKAGALGYVLKENSKKELIACLRAVSVGDYFASAQFSGELLRRQKDKKNGSGLLGLTAAERNILRLITENKTSRQIATNLFISIRTVENHRQHICDKLDLHGPHQLLHFALENKTQLKNE